MKIILTPPPLRELLQRAKFCFRYLHVTFNPHNKPVIGHYDQLHFTDEGTGPERLRNLPEFTKLGGGIGRVQTQEV